MNHDTMYNVTKDEIQKIINKLQWLQKKMEDEKIDTIRPEANTYLLYEYISIPGKGFINLYDFENYVGTSFEDWEVE